MNQQQTAQLAKELSDFCKKTVHTLKTAGTKRVSTLTAIVPAFFGALLAGSTPDKGEYWDNG